jgi:hypothetical protein
MPASIATSGTGYCQAEVAWLHPMWSVVLHIVQYLQDIVCLLD